MIFQISGAVLKSDAGSILNVKPYVSLHQTIRKKKQILFLTMKCLVTPHSSNKNSMVETNNVDCSHYTVSLKT